MTKPYLSGSVRVRDGFWIARFRLPTGKDSTRKLGREWKKRGEQPPEGYDTKRTALVKLNEILSGYEGWTPGSDPQFQFAADEYLQWQRNERKLRETTCHEYERIIENVLKPAFGRKILSAITEPDVVSLRSDLAARVSGGSLNQTRIVFAGIVKHARKKRGYRGADPSQWFERAVSRPKLNIDVYSPQEVELVARTMRSGKHRDHLGEPKRALSEAEISERRRMDDQDAVIIKTAAYAGLRLGEIRALRWRDVDFTGSKIVVRRSFTDHGGMSYPKSGKARSIPMSSKLAAELDSLSRRPYFTSADDLVFCSAIGGVLHGGGIYHRFVAGTKAAGLRRLRFHDLRHGFCSMMVEIFPLSDVKEYAGHADIATTMRYVHFVPQSTAASKMDELLAAKLGPTPSFDQIPTTEEVG